MEQPIITERRGRPTPRRDDYVPIPSEPLEHDLRQAEDDSPITGCCQALATKLTIGLSPPSKRDSDEPLMEVGSGRLNRNRARRADPCEEVREKLYADIERLQKNISERNERNDRRRARLEELKAQDEAEKWEDELYLTRIQELNDAHAKIETSSVSTKDILRQVYDLNNKISYIASEIIESPLSGMRNPELNVEDTIQKNLGKAFVFFFQSDAYPALEDRQLVQAVLQIFLARSCVDLIDCWALGRHPINRGMDKLYDQLLKTETQLVAGKWRQLAFRQMPPGWSLETHATRRARQALEILACAGWGGEFSRVKPLIKELVVMADELRINVKANVISSDLQPWVAMAGTKYRRSAMKDVTHRLTTLGRSDQLHVLGSTEIGLREYRKAERSTLVQVELSRTRVLCVEPLRRRLHETQTRVPPSAPAPQPLTRGRSS